MLSTHIRISKSTPTRTTHEWVVRGSASDRRAWLRRAPVCVALGRRGITHVGVASAVHPYAVRRPRLTGLFVMACLEGAGEVLLDNRWRPFRAGQACLAPPYAPNAYRCVRGERWEFVWVRYLQPSAQRPLVAAAAPLLAAFDARGLHSAVLGLHGEAKGPAAPAVLDSWVDLMETYVRRFTQPWREDDRLHRAWQSAADGLGRAWTVRELAALAGVGEEQFRRLCRSMLGRSPQQQLTWMRVERAAARIGASTDKLEVIAREVGYESVFTFSNTFLRLMGTRPSDYRAQSPKVHRVVPTTAA